jgi:hypothetical protein
MTPPATAADAVERLMDHAVKLNESFSAMLSEPRAAGEWTAFVVSMSARDWVGEFEVIAAPISALADLTPDGSAVTRAVADVMNTVCRLLRYVPRFTERAEDGRIMLVPTAESVFEFDLIQAAAQGQFLRLMVALSALIDLPERATVPAGEPEQPVLFEEGDRRGVRLSDDVKTFDLKENVPFRLLKAVWPPVEGKMYLASDLAQVCESKATNLPSWASTNTSRVNCLLKGIKLSIILTSRTVSVTNGHEVRVYWERK